jgi:GNAT superfamily N-acetyltransferase
MMTTGSPAARFDALYRETVRLLDGSRVTLRLVRPEDKQLLRRGFERLSPESRYRRFLAAKTELSDAELAYLTEVDGWNHFAIGAVTVDAAGAEEGVAIARFIRSSEDPRSAEAAVAVIDDWQRKGLGTILLLRLVAAARERGIDRFAGEALAANQQIREVLGQLAQGVRVRGDGPELGIEVDLPAVPAEAMPTPEDHEAPLRRLLGLLGRGVLRVRRAMTGR